ncbi:MAG TPA: superoxide dismutase [Verrucomicrobia bacterium]|nr:superoxide dismutase [Verrucomicrobiota bacterium]HOB32470.1 superoxide dismutase [Verrucomicrobiota bacterium]HOP96670.1 superoxide dismutase [Verrucomicrobiota bacterium]
MMTRRTALKHSALAALAAAATPSVLAQPAPAASATAQSGPFTLPLLPYPVDALEPHIDAKTMEIHHGRHHAGYVNNLNKALSQASVRADSVEDLLKDLNSVPESIRTAVRNNGGGHYNHSLFWQMMKKGGGGEPRGDLAKAIAAKFGGLDKFKQEFASAAGSRFGSGWAWLVLANGQLQVESTPNQDSPISQGRIPLLGIDVWEHAYYLKYQNRRADYVNAWWNVVNWDFVTERYEKFRRA